MSHQSDMALVMDETRQKLFAQAFGNRTEDLKALTQDLEKANLDAYNHKVGLQRPLFEQRSEIIRTIPGFWLAAITNDPNLSPFIDPLDRLILQHLVHIQVTHDAVDARNVTFTFQFDKNEAFSDATLTKEFVIDEQSPTLVTSPHSLEPDMKTKAVKIHWSSEDDNVVRKRPRSAEDDPEIGEQSFGSFFNWFLEDDDQFGIHELLLDLHANALEAYAGLLDLEGDDTSDVTDDDEDDDDSDDDPNAVVDLETASDTKKPRRKRARV